MNVQQQLLENALDALDRLYDREMYLEDLYAILFATAYAVAASEIQTELIKGASEVRRLMSARLKDEEEYTQALIATDQLRILLANAT